MRNFVTLVFSFCAVIAGAGCNSFERTYSGASYPESSDAIVAALDDQTLARFQEQEYSRIGTAEFVDTSLASKRVNKRAREAAMKKGADAVLVGSTYLGEREQTGMEITHYAWVKEYNAKNNTWEDSWEPQYEMVTTMVPQYKYSGVFLKRNASETPATCQ